MIRIVGHLAEAEAGLAKQVAELAVLPYSELERLPAWLGIESSHDGVEFVRYVKTLPDGRLEVVVQASRQTRRFLFITLGQMAAEGFLDHSRGRGGTDASGQAL